MELLWILLSHVFLLLCLSVLIVLESWSWGTLTLSWGKERLILDGKTLGSVWCSGFTSHNPMEKWSHCRLLQFQWSAVGFVHTQKKNIFGGGVKKICVCVCIYIYCMYFYCILYVLILYYITYNIYRNICILLSNVNYFLICILYICGETAQRSAHELPQVEKASISSCPVSGGEEMVITGSNFFPESKVIFLEKGPGKNQWGSSAILDGSFFSPYIGSLEHLFNHFCLIFCHIYHIISFISLGPILPTYFSHFIHNLNQINISYPFINLASSYALSYSQQVIISKLTPLGWY